MGLSSSALGVTGAVLSACREIGRLRVVFESLEDGRCCHDMVFECESVGLDALGSAKDLVGGDGGGFDIPSSVVLFLPLDGAKRSFVGDLEEGDMLFLVVKTCSGLDL